MSDKTCKTCKHLGELMSEYHPGEYVCEHPKIVALRIFDNDNEHETLESDAAGALDGSGYFAAIVVGPDFGCIHHQENTDA